jgi:predicted dithiol-disulfide oxidoreductase (DUF899 family)
LTDHRVVPHEEWLDARRALLTAEKEFTRLRDRLSRQRRELPWERVEKDYRFTGPDGTLTLADLFAGRSQLIVYHFMFDPSWDAGCLHCSFWADSFDRGPVHLQARDVTFVAVSRAPYPKLAAYRSRMGWDFTWVSSFESDFNRDLGVSFTDEERANGTAFYNYKAQNPYEPEREGVSVFFKDEGGQVFHTYSAYARGIDLLNVVYNYLDLVPNGRGEEGHDPQYWVRRHDEYSV